MQNICAQSRIHQRPTSAGIPPTISPGRHQAIRILHGIQALGIPLVTLDGEMIELDDEPETADPQA